MKGRNDHCRSGSGNKWKKCHSPDPGPSKLPDNGPGIAEEYKRKYNILIKNEEQIAGIRASSRLASSILDQTCAPAKEGITTLELNEFAHRLHIEAGAIPASLHYGEPPFPKSICTSINEVICHGIPDKTVLREGDIINIDVACIFKGYYGDCSRMVTIGNITPDKQLVVDVSYECLMRSIEILKPGIPVSAIGDVIEAYASSKKCSIVYQFVGHGVGLGFQENPQIYHNRNTSRIKLIPGMIFTIEPMINAGVAEAVVDNKDHWTARTKDSKPSAQWEHTILITETGHEVLTNWIREYK